MTAAAQDSSKRIEELFKKGTKMSVQEKLELATLLNGEAKKEEEQQRQTVMEDIRAYIEKAGYSISDVADYFKSPAAVIFGPWVDKNNKSHTRYEGEKGKLPIWTTELKDTVSKADAMKMAIGEKGKKFIENLYAV
jgi:hypothetical protein